MNEHQTALTPESERRAALVERFQKSLSDIAVAPAGVSVALELDDDHTVRFVSGDDVVRAEVINEQTGDVVKTYDRPHHILDVDA